MRLAYDKNLTVKGTPCPDLSCPACSAGQHMCEAVLNGCRVLLRSLLALHRPRTAPQQQPSDLQVAARIRRGSRFELYAALKDQGRKTQSYLKLLRSGTTVLGMVRNVRDHAWSHRQP